MRRKSGNWRKKTAACGGGNSAARYAVIPYRYAIIEKEYGMKNHDCVPVKDADFDVWFKNLCQTVTQKTGGAAPEWTHIPAAEVTLLTNGYTAWYAAYGSTLTPHTPAQTLAKDEARQTAEGVIRPFVGQWLVWKQVSDQEREDMGLHNPKPRRPHIPAPTTVPELNPAAGHPRQIVVPYRDKGSARRGKPADIHGIEVRWAFMDHPPRTSRSLTTPPSTPKAPLSWCSRNTTGAGASTWPAAGKSSGRGSRAISATSSRRLCRTKMNREAGSRRAAGGFFRAKKRPAPYARVFLHFF
jgi:hypothetical protein